MAFAQGHEKVGGRRKGVPNKATAAVRELAQDLVGDHEYLKRLQQRLKRGQAGSMETMLWQYAFGRPTERPETTNEVPHFDFEQVMGANFAQVMGAIGAASAPLIKAKRERAEREAAMREADQLAPLDDSVGGPGSSDPAWRAGRRRRKEVEE